ncbi:MAG: RNase adapter RapZ [Lachnospiraceae bacterium]|nr:RNase adapter RapZ [Lachnospiraceae bacterium]
MIVSGMSGSGKSKALDFFEDNGYYCLDNLPSKLLVDIVRMLGQLEDFPNKACITIDVRDVNIYKEAGKALNALKEIADIKLLFLECDSSVLLKRYKETRRLHPLMMSNPELDLESAIETERGLLADLRAAADFTVDTSMLSTVQFREKLLETIPASLSKPMTVSFVAFGYKYGISADFDLVFDVRCLPNPFYVEDLKGLTGKDKEVRDFVMSSADSQALFARIREYLDTAIPMYEKEGKAQLVVGFGCTGGQHRSLTFAILMADYYREKGYQTSAIARDTARNIRNISDREQ